MRYRSGSSGSMPTSSENMVSGFAAISQSARETENTTERMFGGMERASDNALRSMMLGTRNWQQAMSRAFAEVAYTFTREMVSKRIFSWIRSETLMTDATLAGIATRTASEQAASGTSLALQARSAVARIFNDAQQVFSGIFAFLAPVMGPAAIAPASAGSASVAALASNILFAQQGAWNVGKDTLAFLHQGEMVVPKTFASSLRDAGGVGDGSPPVAIHIHAIDTRSGAEFLRSHAPVIAETVAQQMRQFNRHLTQSWKG